MTFVILGLGNPGKEHEGARHNTGRMAVEMFRRFKKFPDWRAGLAEKSEGKLVKKPLLLLRSGLAMNLSGQTAAVAVKSRKAAERLIVIHDDLDLPLGSFRIGFGRGSGGHRGVESVMKSLRTKNFIRLRIGISPGAAGRTQKPSADKVVDFILGRFRPAEIKIIRLVFRRTARALEEIIGFGWERAASRFH